MKKNVSLLVAVCVLISLFAAACSPSPDGKGQVNVYNWGEYIDKEVLSIFEEETGIKINYFEYDSNESLYSLLMLGSADIDVIIPSDYMVARLIDEDMLEPLDFSNIPNFSLIDSRYKGLEYDSNDAYSVAYMAGTVGLIYNSAMIDDEITSWGALFDEQYSGQILMFDNPRDAFGIALKYLGYSQNTENEDEIYEAYDLLLTQKPILQAYVMDQIFDKLESGEAAIGPYYAGDYLFMAESNEDLVFVRPEEGSNFFVDAMCIPKGAKNKTNAEIFIDFMCRTDIALMNMEEIYYASANYEAAEEFSAQLDDGEYEIMFASEAVLADCDVFIHLPANILELYNRLWTDVKK
ncbi:MAG: spermidine/putrescine ABC transporter substrate-binding protein [Oscillospiraceae bacterium]|nr:spermidine/putrescine ABC transporter substrate-binding protein [Oscillospiraceae bacterium]